MAVEARHLNMFLPQILSNRDIATSNVQNYGHVSNANPQMAYRTTTTATYNNPMYGFPMKNVDVKSESGVTYVSDTRKRPRDGTDNDTINNDFRGCYNTSLLFGEDLALQIHQQQLDIDRFISQHTERVRIEMEERRKRYSKQMAVALAHHMKKKLKSKDDELIKIGKLNLALEERVKSLSVENQIWRDLAQTNEATANALRRNLEQVLAQRQQQQRCVADDDARSYCGSNYEDDTEARDPHARRGNINTNNNKMCRRCEREESCVLLLPCRHLCLCTACGSSTDTCPVCYSIKTASLQVNVSL